MTALETLDSIAELFGRATREAVMEVGAISIFFWKVLRVCPTLIFKKFHLLTEQMLRIGVGSIPLIAFISVFIGAITVWQIKYFFADMIPYSMLGTLVGKAVFTDLGPVLTGLVITGRIGAMLAAELGTMKVTEQVAAMEILSLDPFLYLLAPRILSGFIMMPMLGIISSFLAIESAQLLAAMALDVSFDTFYNGVRLLFRVQDVIIMLTKTFVFGGVVALSGCYFGYLTHGGAVEVGQATNRAVVRSSILILMMNLVVAALLL